MNQAKQRLKYFISDAISAALAWWMFFSYRKQNIEAKKFGQEFDWQYDDNFYYGLVLLPLFWIVLYFILGMYNKIYRRYRLKEISQVTFTTILGVTFIFFFLILDDEIESYKTYYNSFLTLLYLHFTPTIIGRFLLTNQTVKKVHRKEIGFNTIYIGGSKAAADNYQELLEIKNYPGFKFIGYIAVNGSDRFLSDAGLNLLGKLPDLINIIDENNIEEVIIGLDSSDHQSIGKIFNVLQDRDVNIKMIPDMYDIAAGSVKMTSIFGSPLIEVNPELLPPWQKVLKRCFDVFASGIALIILSPVFLILSILVKLSSPGPIFFSQERIGKNKKPFQIYKFRSMYIDAEAKGPQLSSSKDKRITPIGLFLRKTRLDEIPQFYNVIKGDMSIVGPRPERQFYIDKIMERAPHYVYLQKVKPGITSWGQVKYGYAENVDQMIQRLKFDLLYIENMSFALDIKIMFYTIITVLKGSGK